MRNEPLDLSTVSLSLPRDLVLASAVQLLESHKMHSKWNLLQNLTRTIRQALEKTVVRTDVDGWRAGGVGGVSGGGGGGGKAGRGVLHTSSCRLKREDEGGKGGGRRERRTNSG